MPSQIGQLAFLGAARFQGSWDADTNEATGQSANYLSLLTSGVSVNGGYHSSTGLTASAGDYWQVTGSGAHNVDGQTDWDLNDWVIFSGSAGNPGWVKLAYEDTIASIIVGGLASFTSSFHMGHDNDKHIIFASASVHSGSGDFTYDYNTGRMFVSGGMDLTGSLDLGSASIYYDATALPAYRYLIISGSHVPGVPSGGGVVISGSNIIQTASTSITLNSDANINLNAAGNILIGAGTDGTGTIQFNAGNSSALMSFNEPAAGYHPSGSIKIDDNIKLYFGTYPAGPGSYVTGGYIEYNADGDQYMVISGSHNGIAVSGNAVFHDDVQINGNIGIGTAFGISPQDQLHVEKSTGAVIELHRADSSIATNENLGTLYFGGTEDGGTSYDYGATIRAVADGGWTIGADIPTRLEFFTVEDGSTTQTQRMVIKNDGRVGIGIPGSYPKPDQTLSVTGTMGVSGSALFRSDVQINGALTGGSPLQVSGGMNVTGTFDSVADFGVQASQGDAMATYSNGEGHGEIIKLGVFDSSILTKGMAASLHQTTWYTADANITAPTGSSGSAANKLGAVLDVDGGGNEGKVLLRGTIRITGSLMNNYSGSTDVGRPVYLSTTAGEYDLEVPITSADKVRIVGYLMDTDGADHLIYFCPDNTWIEVS